MATKKKNDKEFKSMSKEQLEAKLLETQKEHQKRRFSKVTGELTQTHLIAEARKDIARIKTELRKLELQLEKAK